MAKKKSGIAKRRGSQLRSGGQEYLAKLEEITGIAATFFRDNGYSSTSLKDIAEVAGVDRATLYYYVSGKNELFRKLVLDGMKTGVEMIERIAGSDAKPLKKIDDYIHEMILAFHESFPHMYVCLQEDVLHNLDTKTAWGKSVSELNKRFDQALVSIVQEGLDDGSIRSIGDARTIAFGIIGMVNWSHRWYDPKKGSDPRIIGDIYSEMICSGLKS